MEHWIIEAQGSHRILTHYCPYARSNEGSESLRQDIGGGYVRCDRCGEKFLPEEEPGNPRLLLRVKMSEESSADHPSWAF